MHEIGLDQSLDDIDDFVGRDGRSDDLTDRGAIALRAPDGDLVELFTVLVDAEDSDVSDVVVSAGVDAAGDVDLDLADVVQRVQVVEVLLDRIGDRNRPGIGEVAEVPAGAGDDVRGQPDVRCGQPCLAYLVPEYIQIGAAHVGQHQVLFVGDADTPEAKALGPLGDVLHLLRGDIPRHRAGPLGRQGHDRVAGLLVCAHVAPNPCGEGLVVGDVLVEAEILVGHVLVIGIVEVARDTVDFGRSQRGGTVLEPGPFRFDLFTERIDADRIDEGLDARLVQIVAAPEAIVDAQDRLAVR